MSRPHPRHTHSAFLLTLTEMHEPIESWLVRGHGPLWAGSSCWAGLGLVAHARTWRWFSELQDISLDPAATLHRASSCRRCSHRCRHTHPRHHAAVPFLSSKTRLNSAPWLSSSKTRLNSSPWLSLQQNTAKWLPLAFSPAKHG